MFNEKRECGLVMIGQVGQAARRSGEGGHVSAAAAACVCVCVC